MSNTSSTVYFGGLMLSLVTVGTGGVDSDEGDGIGKAGTEYAQELRINTFTISKMITVLITILNIDHIYHCGAN